MAEWLKAHAWKACKGKPFHGFESHSLRHKLTMNLEVLLRVTLINERLLNEQFNVKNDMINFFR